MAEKLTIDVEIKGKETVSEAADKGAKGVEKLDKTVTNSGKNAKDAGASFKSLAGAFTSMVVAKHAAATLGSLMKPAIELETATVDLEIATGKTGTELAKLATSAKMAAAATAFTPTEALESMRALSLSVTNTDEATKAILPVLSLAQTYFGQNAKTATDFAVTLMRAGLAGDNLTRSLGETLGAARLAGVQLPEISVGFKKVGAAAALVGQGLRQVAPLYMLMARSGMPARESATGLFRAFQQLSQTKNIEKLQSQLGVVVKEGGKLRDTRHIMLDLAKAWDQTSDKVAFQSSLVQIFGSRALAPLVGLLRILNQGMHVTGQGFKSGTDLLAAFDVAMNESGTTLEDMAQRRLQTFAMAWETLKESVSVALSTVFMPFVQSLTPLIGLIRDGVSAFGAWLQSGSPLAQLFSILTNAAARLLAIFGSFISVSLLLAGAGTVVRGALRWAGVEMGLLGLRTLSAIRSKTALIVTLNGVAAAYRGATVSAVGFAASLRGIAVAAKFMWKALIGPLLWLLTIGLVIYDIFKLVFGKKETAPAQKNLASALDLQAANIRGQADASRELAQTTSELSATVDKWKKAMDTKLPQPSSKAIGTATARMRELGASGRVAGEDFEEMRKGMEFVQRIDEQRQKALLKGGKGFPVAEELLKASGYIQRYGQVLKLLYPNQEKWTDALLASGKEMERAAVTTQAEAKLLKGVGYLKASAQSAELETTETQLAKSREGEKAAAAAATEASGFYSLAREQAAVSKVPISGEHLALMARVAQSKYDLALKERAAAAATMLKLATSASAQAVQLGKTITTAPGTAIGKYELQAQQQLVRWTTETPVAEPFTVGAAGYMQPGIYGESGYQEEVANNTRKMLNVLEKQKPQYNINVRVGDELIPGRVESVTRGMAGTPATP